MEQHITKEHRDKNIITTSEARGHIIKFQGQIEDLTKQLGEMREEVTRAFQWASVVESQRDKALTQLSALEESYRQRDEALACAEDRVQQTYEECLQEYKNSAELKEKIQRAYEARLEEYKAFAGLKERVYKKAFCMFASGFNQGLKAARDAPSTLLADLRSPKVNFDGKEVCYREDDNSLPKNTLPLLSRLQGGIL